MRDAGAVIVDPADIATAKQLDEPEFEVLLYEFKADLNAYLAGLGPAAPVHSLADVIALQRSQPGPGDALLRPGAHAEGAGEGPADRRHVPAGAGRLPPAGARRGHRRDAGEAPACDAIVAPTGGPAWLTDSVNGDHYGGGSSTPAAVAGYPHITVPAGYVCGLPVGISFFGPAWREPALLRLAYAFEQATQVRKPPEFCGERDTMRIPAPKMALRFLDLLV